MYGLLDNLTPELGFEIDLPFEIFATSFNLPEPAADEEEEEISAEGLAALLYTKEAECPVCRAKFNNTLVRESKLRLSHMDELRPVYRGFEPLCYGITMCTTCGYAAFKDRFDVISDRQRETLLQHLRINYANFMPASYPMELDEKMGIERFKYALLTAYIKKVSLGEKAMLLTKTAWLYKAMGDEVNTSLFSKYANDVWTQAYQSERFPIFGLSEATVHFLLARFAFDLGDHGTSLRFLSQIIVDQNLSTRMRDMARDLKEQINQTRTE
ncbi:MAG: DUF2225 domain-containing protein [Defluviitaleaceae bacterium]|nr:DUF2225 domain-containing protein [Defluviitaleaceae bacterium]